MVACSIALFLTCNNCFNMGIPEMWNLAFFLKFFILQSFPRSIVLSESGRQLIQWPIKEIEKLRSNKVDLQNENLKGGSVYEISGVTASQVNSIEFS